MVKKKNADLQIKFYLCHLFIKEINFSEICVLISKNYRYNSIYFIELSENK